jgi:hypothetical protein
MREQLQSSDRIFNQQQTILHALEISVTVNTIGTRHRRNRATLKRAGYKAMCINKLTVKTGAGELFFALSQQDYARAYRTRVDGIISNLFVKHLGAHACRIRAHQSCCLAKVHVITASSNSIDSSSCGG